MTNDVRPAEALLGADEQPVAIVFGPENGAVSEKLVYEVAREAHVKSYEHVIVIGLGIEPQARELVAKIEQQIGIPVVYVQATTRSRDQRLTEDDALEPALLRCRAAGRRDPQGGPRGKGRPAAVRGRAPRPRRLRPDGLLGRPSQRRRRPGLAPRHGLEGSLLRRIAAFFPRTWHGTT